MTTNDEQLDEVQVILDVEIGHGICPDDETNDTCKLIKVAQLIKADKEQAVLAARIHEIDMALDKEDEDPTTHYLTDRYAKLQWLAKVQQASQKGTHA